MSNQKLPEGIYTEKTLAYEQKIHKKKPLFERIVIDSTLLLTAAYSIYSIMSTTPLGSEDIFNFVRSDYKKILRVEYNFAATTDSEKYNEIIRAIDTYHGPVNCVDFYDYLKSKKVHEEYYTTLKSTYFIHP